MMSRNVFRMLQGFTPVLVVTGMAMSLTVTPTWTAELPKRKSGLWELKMSSPQMPGGSRAVETCVDETADNILKQDDTSNQTCSEPVVRRDGDRLIIDKVCKSDETTVTRHTELTGRFDSAIRAETKMNYNPPLSGMKERTMVIEARWLGPCKPGQKPGDTDMVLPQIPNRPPGRP